MLALILIAGWLTRDCPSQISVEQVFGFDRADETGVSVDPDLIERLNFLPAPEGNPENAWQLMTWQAAQTTNETTHCLFELVAQEQFVRLAILDPEQANDYGGQESLVQVMSFLDGRNRAWLGYQVARDGWFTIGGHGETADLAAWLIAQHADNEPSFQQEILVRLEPLARAGETNAGRFAMLRDRVAVNLGEAQHYGSQGRCTESGQWEPRPYYGTEDEVDERRRSVGLATFRDYANRMSEICNRSSVSGADKE